MSATEITRPRARLRRIDARDARLSNALLCSRGARIDVGGSGVDVELSSATHSALAVDASAALVLETQFGTLALAPGGAFARLLGGIELPSQSEASDELRWMLAQAVLANAPPGWRDLLSLRSVQLGALPTGAAQVLLRLRCADDGWSLAGHLWGEHQAITALVESPGWASQPASAQLDEERLRVRRPVHAGVARLAWHELRELCVGDVLLADRVLIDRDAKATIDLGGLLLEGELRHEGFLFERWREEMEELTAPAPGPDAGDGGAQSVAPVTAGAPPALDALPLTLVFELGCIEVSVAALRRLAPGSVIELQRPAPPAIVVRCGGLAVARGELVDLDGRLGVEITQLESAS